MFALPMAAAAASVTVPATDDAALSAVAGLFVAVPRRVAVLLRFRRLLTLAAPDVSVVSRAAARAGVRVCSCRPSRWRRCVPVEPLTDDGQEAAPSVTPELVESLLPPELLAELLSADELLPVELLLDELPDRVVRAADPELPESELPESELLVGVARPEPLDRAAVRERRRSSARSS